MRKLSDVSEARLHSTMYDLFGSHVNAKLDKPPRRALDVSRQY